MSQTTEIDIEKLPDKLKADRQIIECNFILNLFKEPDRFDDYPNVKNGEDILTIDGIFYYGILENMLKSGYSEISDMSIHAYLENHEGLKKRYEETGGFKTIQEIMSLTDSGNLDKYYDDLVKSNFLIRLYKKGFNVLPNMEKFADMDAESVYDYYIYQLSNVSVGKIEKIQEIDLSDGYLPFIDEWDKGDGQGYRIALPMLNYRLLGIHRQNLMLHLSGIGFGKTTSAISWYIMPAIEDGNDVCIIANEQGESEWRQMLLSTIAFNKLNVRIKGFDRHKIMQGGYTPEEKKALERAQEWIKQQSGKLKLFSMSDYGISNIKKIITKYSKIGTGLFVVDTLKPPIDADERAYAKFIDLTKELFQVAKKRDVAIIATAQLTPDAMSRRYLDLTCIGRAKQAAEVADTVVMFRPMSQDEKEREGQVFVWENGEKKNVTLNPDNEFISIFVAKNRWGPTTPQIVVERNMSFNSYKQMGWWVCPFDQFRNR